MSSQPALCEVEGAQPCGELISLREKVNKQEQRINSVIDNNNDTSLALRTVADRVGAMRPDGTCTPHSLTGAVQKLGNQVLDLKRSIDDRLGINSSSTPSQPPRLLSALGDLSEDSRLDIERPDLAILRRRKAVRQRNWTAVGLAIIGLAEGFYQALKLAGIIH